MKSICSVKTNQPWVALSFDDGPAASTRDILDILKEHNTQAAFFLIGKNISGNEELIRRMVQEGHIIGNHSFSHHSLFDLFSSKRMLKDMDSMNQSVQNITGFKPRFFRPPYGVTNPNLKKAVMAGGFISVGWSIRSLDTIIRNPHRLMNKILSAIRPGAILLLHDTSQTTVDILPELLKSIRQKGFEIVRLDKMVNLNPYE